MSLRTLTFVIGTLLLAAPSQAQTVMGAAGVSTSGYVYAGTISATSFRGDGSLLVNLPPLSGDRITSSTTSVVTESTGLIRINISGTNTGYFDTAGRLIAPGVSATTLNGISSTSGYFSGSTRFGTTTGTERLEINGNANFSVTNSAGNTPVIQLTNLTSSTNNAFGPMIGFANGVGGGNHGFVISLFQSSPTVLAIANNVSPWQQYVTINQAGNVGIGITAPLYPLDVSGSARAAAFLYSSDRRLKENLSPLNTTLAQFNTLTPYRYTYISDTTHTPKIGLLAQDVEKIFPEAVQTDASGFKSVDYPALVPALFKAVQDLQKEVEQLKAQQQNAQR